MRGTGIEEFVVTLYPERNSAYKYCIERGQSEKYYTAFILFLYTRIQRVMYIGHIFIRIFIFQNKFVLN